MLGIIVLVAAAVALGYWIVRSYSLTIDGVTLKKGDRVRIAKRAGTVKSEATGHSRELDAGPGQTGSVVGFQRLKNGHALVRVKWDAQKWKELDRARWVDLREFTDRMHPSYLEVLRPGQVNGPVFEPIMLKDGTLVRPGDRVKIVKFAGTAGGEVTGHSREVDLAPGHTGTVYGRRAFWSGDNEGVVVHWDPQKWKEHERDSWVTLSVFERIVLAERLGRPEEAAREALPEVVTQQNLRRS